MLESGIENQCSKVLAVLESRPSVHGRDERDPRREMNITQRKKYPSIKYFHDQPLQTAFQ
jgi:hypothetical protein